MTNVLIATDTGATLLTDADPEFANPLSRAVAFQRLQSKMEDWTSSVGEITARSTTPNGVVLEISISGPQAPGRLQILSNGLVIARSPVFALEDGKNTTMRIRLGFGGGAWARLAADAPAALPSKKADAAVRSSSSVTAAPSVYMSASTEVRASASLRANATVR